MGIAAEEFSAAQEMRDILTETAFARIAATPSLTAPAS